MPEYPDVTVYIARLDARLRGDVLGAARIASPFVLRTAHPPIEALCGKEVRGFRRIGKQVVFVFPDALYLVVHLRIAGRLHWRELGAKLPAKGALAALDFGRGTVLFTEAGSKKRASIHVVEGDENLAMFDRGGPAGRRSSSRRRWRSNLDSHEAVFGV